MTKSVASLLLLVSCAFACGDDDSSASDTSVSDTGTADVGLNDVRVICEGSVAYDEKCGDDPIEPIEECEADLGCTPYREDLKSLIGACLAERDCGTSDDMCFSSPGIDFTATPAADAFFAACQSRRRDCADVFNEDWCYVQIATDEAIAMLDTCLGEACSDIQRCFAPIVSCR